MNRPAYTPPSVPKACPWKLRGVVRGFLCFYLALSIAFIPLDFRISTEALDDTPIALEVQQNEAHAIIPVVAGGTAAAAAALGITEAELIAGLAVTFAAGTGLYLYYKSDGLSTWPTDIAWPGFKPWDDLTPQEKQDWVGQDGTAEDYWQQQFDLYSLNYGLWQYDQNGQPTPTPEPEDPDDKEKWFTKNNVITALGTGAAVGLGTIASTFVGDAANSLADMLFGSSNAGSSDRYAIGLPYTRDFRVLNAVIPQYYWNDFSYKLGSGANETRYNVSSTGWYLYRSDSGGVFTKGYRENATATEPRAYYAGQYDVIYSVTATGTYATFNSYTNINNASNSYNVMPDGSAAGTNQGTYSLGVVPNSYTGYMNPVFAGNYIFKNGSTEVARINNGVITGNASFTNTDYGQMVDTPGDLYNNVFNDTNYYNNVNNWANVDSDNQKAAQLPTIFATDPPTYTDYVKTLPNDEVVTIPNDEPYIPTNPDNPVTPDEDFTEGFEDEVARLLSQPFDQLFPFCLIGDLRVFTQKVNSAFNGGSGLRSEPNFDELVIPLEQFNVDGLEDITFDLVPLKGMGAIVKPWINALLVVALLIGSFRFFLNRGGE